MSTSTVPGAGVLNFHVKNVDASLHISNLDQQVSESILWELFLRCGPLQSVSVHRDKALNSHLGSATVEFRSTQDADYGTLIMQGISLYGKKILVKKSQSTTSTSYVDPTVTSYDGLVTLRVANLAPEVTDFDFRSIFSQFGQIQTSNLVYDKETGAHLGYGFVKYLNFESGDYAISRMHGQQLANRQVIVEYAIKNADTGERYGNPTDRLLLQKMEQNGIVVVAPIDISQVSGVGTNALASGGIGGHYDGSFPGESNSNMVRSSENTTNNYQNNQQNQNVKNPSQSNNSNVNNTPNPQNNQRRDYTLDLTQGNTNNPQFMGNPPPPPNMIMMTAGMGGMNNMLPPPPPHGMLQTSTIMPPPPVPAMMMSGMNNPMMMDGMGNPMMMGGMVNPMMMGGMGNQMMAGMNNPMMIPMMMQGGMPPMMAQQMMQQQQQQQQQQQGYYNNMNQNR